jgi:hypothetical protein
MRPIARQARNGNRSVSRQHLQAEFAHRLKNFPRWRLQWRGQAHRTLWHGKEAFKRLASAGKRQIHKQLAISVQ